ncbi:MULTISPECIES: hypothetical protein [Xenorhabdus]|uniref:hypothetical protein n=1 Tax=Xenorhabdus TaxID=626 RepID=UPI000647CF4C|nr:MULTISPECIES: hypothetical protein [Xenorhabdus]MBC8946297.1 hypothetical protein [Xenorhabdus indica]
MINKKISILAGLFLSLVAGAGMAAEDKVTNTAETVFSCAKWIPDGEYLGKFENIIRMSKAPNNHYWFVNQKRNLEGCIRVERASQVLNPVVYDAFLQGKTITIRVVDKYVTDIRY